MILKRCYIAGPYTNGDVAANVARAMDAWHRLADAGFVPFCPHLSHFLHLHRQRPYEEWLAHDLEWLLHCSFVVRLDGYSPGADREIERATAMGVYVYESVEDAIANES